MENFKLGSNTNEIVLMFEKSIFKFKHQSSIDFLYYNILEYEHVLPAQARHTFYFELLAIVGLYFDFKLSSSKSFKIHKGCIL